MVWLAIAFFLWRLIVAMRKHKVKKLSRQYDKAQKKAEMKKKAESLKKGLFK